MNAVKSAGIPAWLTQADRVVPEAHGLRYARHALTEMSLRLQAIDDDHAEIVVAQLQAIRRRVSDCVCANSETAEELEKLSALLERIADRQCELRPTLPNLVWASLGLIEKMDHAVRASLDRLCGNGDEFCGLPRYVVPAEFAV